MSLVLPSSYFGPIYHFSLIVNSESYFIESKENFIRQSYRNRFEILGANGLLSLTIPVKKWKNHTSIDKIEVSFDENWQQLHWRSIESAYKASPFFEFYEEEIKPLIFSMEVNLIKRNSLIEKAVNRIINIQALPSFTEFYEVNELDYRAIINPKNKVEMQAVSTPKYIQVFEDKHDFIANLSILDLLFNLGPETKTYLLQLNQSIKDGTKN